MLEMVCLVALVISLGYGWRTWLQRRRYAKAFTWYFASHDNGRHVHAIPDHDGFHVDDHRESCRCSPWTERFERTDGSYGEAIYHRRLHR